MTLTSATSTAKSSAAKTNQPTVLTLGMFIIDEFSYLAADGHIDPSRQAPAPQIGGGGTYAIIGARIWSACLNLPGGLLLLSVLNVQ